MANPKPLHPLGDASRMLAALVDSSDDAIVATDLEGTIRSWNRGAERLFGYSAAEMVGRSIDVLAPSGNSRDVSRLLERVSAGERVSHHETARETRDGRRVDVSLSLSPISDAAGKIVGAWSIERDISSRGRTERGTGSSEALLRSIVESAVDGIIVIDARGRINAFNQAAERLFGYTAGEAIGQNVKILMPSPYREEHDQYLAQYISTGVARIIGIGREVRGQRKDGSTFPLHLSVGEMSVIGERKFIGIVHDLTSRVQMEEQLREQAALVRLGEMAAVIAHEVKNPLAAVRGAIQVVGKRLPAESREASVMSEVIARIDALNQLVKDLLLFARPPQPRPAPVDVTGLITATASLLRSDAAYSQLRIEVEGQAPAVLADAELLKIVFLNLLINSAHAMRGKGLIRVLVTAADSMCHIAVSDTGPGIPAEIRGKLFTPFVTTKARGTGLGLSTVKRLVEAHQGTIEVESPPAGGTTMTVRLPLATGSRS
jgi:two-component system sensor kinase FixL